MSRHNYSLRSSTTFGSRKSLFPFLSESSSKEFSRRYFSEEGISEESPIDSLPEFPLLDLPWPALIRVLQYILVAIEVIVDFEPPPYLNWRLCFANRFLYFEGWKIVFRCNKFRFNDANKLLKVIEKGMYLSYLILSYLKLFEIYMNLVYCVQANIWNSMEIHQSIVVDIGGFASKCAADTESFKSEWRISSINSS